MNEKEYERGQNDTQEQLALELGTVNHFIENEHSLNEKPLIIAS